MFPALQLARSAFAAGGLSPCVLNAANEAAVALFYRENCLSRDLANYGQGLNTSSCRCSLDFTLEWAHNDTIARIMQRHP